MNMITTDIMGHVTKTFIIGIFIGLMVSLFTMIMIKRLAKRAERYELTYIPMTLVESKLWKCVLLTYPLLVGFLFALACVVMKIN